MPVEFSNLTSALACFIAEFIGLSVLVTGFVLAQYHHAWGKSTLQEQTNPTKARQAN